MISDKVQFIYFFNLHTKKRKTHKKTPKTKENSHHIYSVVLDYIHNIFTFLVSTERNFTPGLSKLTDYSL